MITNVTCSVNHTLVNVRSIIGLPPDIVPELTELSDEKRTESMMMLKIPSKKPINVSKIEFVIQYGIYLNDEDEDEDNDSDSDSDTRRECKLEDFSPKDQQIIFDLVKNKAVEYIEFCKNECDYVRKRIKYANITVKDTKIHIEFSNCDLGKIVKRMEVELGDGFFNCIDRVELSNGIYDLSAHLIK